jgi:hypothetical protein
MEDGCTNDDLFELTKIDPWWLAQLRDLYNTSMWLKTKKLGELTKDEMEGLKKKGFSDVQIGRYIGERAVPRGRYGTCVRKQPCDVAFLRSAKMDLSWWFVVAWTCHMCQLSDNCWSLRVWIAGRGSCTHMDVCVCTLVCC